MSTISPQLKRRTGRGILAGRIVGHKLHDFLLLSSLFDLSKPGIYVVSAGADIPKPYSGPEIKWIVAESNNATFAKRKIPDHFSGEAGTTHLYWRVIVYSEIGNFLHYCRVATTLSCA